MPKIVCLEIDKRKDLEECQVQMEGLEPSRCCHHWILSPARLPVPPHLRV